MLRDHRDYGKDASPAVQLGSAARCRGEQESGRPVDYEFGETEGAVFKVQSSEGSAVRRRSGQFAVIVVGSIKASAAPLGLRPFSLAQ
jgi:hypothetical protein